MLLSRSSTPCSSLRKGPVQISHGGSQGFKSPHLHPQTSQVRASPASSRRRSLPAAAAPRPHAQVAVQPRRLAATRRPGDPAPGPTRRPRSVVAASQRTPARHQRAIPAPIQPCPGRPRGRLATISTTAHDDGQVQTDPSADPADLRQPRPPGSARAADELAPGHRGRPCRPRPSQPCGCLPQRHPPPPPGRTQWTREPTDTGHPCWTPDIWTLRRPHRTPDSGRVDRHACCWTPAPDTGLRTLAEDTGTLTKARPASAPLEPPCPAGARWAITHRVPACSCGRCLRRLATMTARRWATCQRETASHTTSQLLGRCAGQAAPWAHCSPRTISSRA
jgi:hypothetical protein